MTEDYVGRARAMIGTPFRPQGRGRDGVDCAGLILAVFAIDAALVGRDYALRGDHRAELVAQLRRFFRPVRKGEARSGDVLLLEAAPDQLHLAVATRQGFIHAHAGLRKVVETPGAPPWPILGRYRRRVRRTKG